MNWCQWVACAWFLISCASPFHCHEYRNPAMISIAFCISLKPGTRAVLVGSYLPLSIHTCKDALVLLPPRDTGRPHTWGSSCWAALVFPHTTCSPWTIFKVLGGIFKLRVISTVQRKHMAKAPCSELNTQLMVSWRSRAQLSCPDEYCWFSYASFLMRFFK